jgi:hypothetical protein
MLPQQANGLRMRQRRDSGNQRCNDEQSQSHQLELVDPPQARFGERSPPKYFAVNEKRLTHVKCDGLICKTIMRLARNA